MRPASKIKPTIIHVKMFNWRIHGVKFSELNKNSTISEYRRQLQNGYETCQVRIDEIMLFTGADYRVFCNNFLTDFDWLAGKGGYSSDYHNVDWPSRMRCSNSTGSSCLRCNRSSSLI